MPYLNRSNRILLTSSAIALCAFCAVHAARGRVQLSQTTIDGDFVAERLHLAVSDTLLRAGIVTYVTLDGLVTTADSFLVALADSTMFGTAPFDTLSPCTSAELPPQGVAVG